MIGRFVVVTLVVLCIGACARTSADPCRVREGLNCADLASERLLEQADYDLALANNDVAAVRIEGACVQAMVSEEIERGCIVDAARRCTELCTLHPCGVLGADGQPSNEPCIDRCTAVIADNALADDAVNAAVVRAAGDPSLCTCAICDEASQPLCDQLWQCAAPSPG